MDKVDDLCLQTPCVITYAETSLSKAVLWAARLFEQLTPLLMMLDCAHLAAEEQWKVLWQAGCVVTHSIRAASQVMPIRLKSTWGDWSTEHECSLPPTPREMDSDMSCLNKKLKFWGCTIQLPNIPKVTESSVTFGQLWNLWGWPRRGVLKKQRCVCQPPALYPVSYSWISVATPCPRLHQQFGQIIISVT